MWADGVAKASRSPQESKDDEEAAPSINAEEKASSKDAPSRPGKPPRPPRKGKANSKSALDSQTTEDQTDTGIKADPPLAEARRGSRTRRNAATAQERLDAPPARGLGTRQTRSRTAAASVATTSSASPNEGTTAACAPEDGGKKRNRRGAKIKGAVKESPAADAEEHMDAANTGDTSAPEKGKQLDPEQNGQQSQGDCINASNGATSQTLVEDMDLEQPHAVPDGAVPSAGDNSKEKSLPEPVNDLREGLPDPGLGSGHSNDDPPASVSTEQAQCCSGNASQADAQLTSTPVDVPLATQDADEGACADSAVTGTFAPSSADLQIGEGTEQQTGVQSTEGCTALVAEVGSQHTLGSTHSIAVSKACNPPFETICPDSEARQEDDSPRRRDTEDGPHHPGSPVETGKDRGQQETEHRRPSREGAIPGKGSAMTTQLTPHVLSPATSAHDVAEAISSKVQDGAPQNVVCTEIPASPSRCSVTGQADVDRHCSLPGTIGLNPVSAIHQEPGRPSSHRKSSASPREASCCQSEGADQELRDAQEQDDHPLSSDRRVLSGVDASIREGGAVAVACLQDPSAPEATQPNHIPVHNSKLGFGANLVSTVRSFLPFVTQNTGDGPTAVAAGKAQVKVSILHLTFLPWQG